MNLIGKYRHYKWKEYEVLGTGKHTETEEDLVFYREIGQDFIWGRPIDMFLEKIESWGESIPRFIKIEL